MYSSCTLLFWSNGIVHRPETDSKVQYACDSGLKEHPSVSQTQSPPTSRCKTARRPASLSLTAAECGSQYAKATNHLAFELCCNRRLGGKDCLEGSLCHSTSHTPRSYLVSSLSTLPSRHCLNVSHPPFANRSNSTHPELAVGLVVGAARAAPPTTAAVPRKAHWTRPTGLEHLLDAPVLLLLLTQLLQPTLLFQPA